MDGKIGMMIKVNKELREFLMVFFRFFLCLLFLVSPLWGDIIHLKDGRKLEGKLIRQGDRYLLKMKYGSLYLKASEIQSIEKRETAEEKLDRARTKLKANDVEGRIHLARRCYKENFPQRARELLLEVLKKNPGHSEAFKIYREWFGPKKNPSVNSPVLQMEIPFSLKKSTWKEVVAYLERTTSLKFEVPGEVKKVLRERRMSLSYRHPGRKLGKALDEICRAYGIGWKLQGEKIVFTLKAPKMTRKKFIHLFENKKLSLQAKTTLGKFLEFFRKSTGIAVVLDANISRALPVQLQVSQEGASLVLKKALAPLGLDFVYLEDLIYISTSENCRKMR